MNKKMNLILGIGSAIMALVAIFVMFSTGFGADRELQSPRGNVFTIMFGSSTMNYNAVPVLIVGFVLLCIAVLAALVAGFLPGKSGSLGFVVVAVLLIAAATMFAFAPAAYKAANASIISSNAEEITLGPGCILTMVFGYLGGALSLYGAYTNFKA